MLYYFFLILGITVSIFLAIKLLKRNKDLSRWIKVKGIVKESDYKVELLPDIFGFLFPSYHPKVNYLYSIEGKTFSSDVISPYEMSFSSFLGFPGIFQAKKFLNSYSKNNEVTVFVNPEIHTQSILIKSKPFFGILLLFLLSFSVIFFSLFQIL